MAGAIPWFASIGRCGAVLTLALSSCAEDPAADEPTDIAQGPSAYDDAQVPGSGAGDASTGRPGGGAAAGGAPGGTLPAIPGGAAGGLSGGGSAGGQTEGPDSGAPGATPGGILGGAPSGMGADAGTSPDANVSQGSESDAGTPADDAGEAPRCDPPPDPSTYKTNDVGGGGSSPRESDHFRVFGGGNADQGLKLLEAAHQCFVVDWCWRSPGLSITNSSGVYNKFNVYTVGSLGNAAGVMKYDAAQGLPYLQVLTGSIGDPRVTVHEFGHAMTLSASPTGGWVDQTRTGAWWETVANWVADTFMTSTYCERARTQAGIASGNSLIDVNKIVGNSHMMIVSDQNYYEAWPFFTYLTNNPDNYPGLGRMVLPNMFKGHKRNNETPLHVLERLSSPISVQQILGRYWARMAYVDIGHPKAQQAFLSRKGALNQGNVDSVGGGTWKVKSARRPQYGGASIVPLKGTGQVSIQVTNLGNGLSESDFTATLSIRNASGSVRYVDLPSGAGQATLASGEEASLVVANTPKTLYQYDAFKAGAPETTGLDFQVQITGSVTP